MRNLIVALVLVVSLAISATAWGAEQTTLYCTHMPTCCTITCAMIDIDICGDGCPTAPLLAEFLDDQGNVLGTATFTGNWAGGESYSELDKPVDADLVCSVRLIKEDECITVTWAKLKVYCGDECWGKWYKVFKGDLCWEPVVVPAPEPVPAPPAPPVMAPPVEKPRAEPKPEPKYEMPAEEPEAEPEVIQVPGRG
jgi:hypothetical protein